MKSWMAFVVFLFALSLCSRWISGQFLAVQNDRDRLQLIDEEQEKSRHRLADDLVMCRRELAGRPMADCVGVVEERYEVVRPWLAKSPTDEDTKAFCKKSTASSEPLRLLEYGTAPDLDAPGRVWFWCRWSK